MSVFSVGKKLLVKYPGLLRMAAFGYNAVSFNSVRGKKGGNQIVKSTAFMSRCKIKIKGSGNKIILGDKCLLKNCSISIIGNNNRILLGENVCVHSGSFCLENDSNTIQIGDKTLICGPCHLSAIEGTQISLGNGCLLSSETFFRTGDSHSILDLSGNRINPSQNIKLGDRVWMGHRAVVLKGASVAEDTIISTGAIVTKAFEDSGIVLAGIPACVVKTGVKWCKERIELSDAAGIK